MTPAIVGVLLSLVALLGWALGDFYTQHISRDMGVWRLRLLISISAAIFFFPFVRTQILPTLANPEDLLLIGAVSAAAFFAGYFSLRALKDGKLAVVEPITGLELPMAVALSVVFLHERPTLIQLLVIAVIFLGIVLASTRSIPHLSKMRGKVERGAIYALIGAVGLALTDFLIGLSSRTMSPVVVSWFSSVLFVVVCGVYVLGWRRRKVFLSTIRKHPVQIIGLCLLNNIAWLAFAYATTLLPISIVVAISESFIAIATLLGIVVNHEKLRKHQAVGVALAVVGIIILAVLTAVA